MSSLNSSTFKACARRNLVFVHGKGGVGKSAVTRALAQALSPGGGGVSRVLSVEFENPHLPGGEIQSIGPQLWHLNAEAMSAFDEFAALKIEKLGFFGIGGAPEGKLRGLGSAGLAGITKMFTHNNLIRYLAQAAPGIHELVLLGKVWYERNHYDHVIVDMPSTGYGLAMFQSTMNFSRLFRGGPLAKDAEEMLDTIRDPAATGHIIVGLPEEMPLREGLELGDFLKDAFPANPPAFLVNRRFPGNSGPEMSAAATDVGTDQESLSPYADSLEDYVAKRRALENFNLKLWSSAGVRFGELEYFIPQDSESKLAQSMSAQMNERGLL